MPNEGNLEINSTESLVSPDVNDNEYVSTEIDSEAGVIDTNDFDIFSQLDDLVLENEHFEHEDDVDGSGVEKSEVEKELEENAENSIEAELQANLEKYSSALGTLDNAPDDTPVSLAGFEGTKADLVSTIKTAEQTKQAYANLESFDKKFIEASDFIQRQAYESQSETFKALQQLDQKLANPALPDADRGAISRQKMQYLQRAQDLKQSSDAQMSALNQQREMVKNQKLEMVGQELRKQFTGEQIDNIGTYASDNGVSVDEIKELGSANVIKLIEKARLYDEAMGKGLSNVKTKTARSMTPKSSSVTQEKPKSKAGDLMDKMGTRMSKEEELDLYAALED